MIFLTTLAAGAVLFAWGFFVLAQLPLGMGFSVVGTSLILLVVHGVLAWILWRFINSLSRNMEFQATRRLLRAGLDDGPETAIDES